MPDYPPLSQLGGYDPTGEANPAVWQLLARLGNRALQGFAAPGRVLASQSPMTSEQMIAPAQAMQSLMMGGAPMAERGAVGAFGGRLARYQNALKEGQITPQEYQSFVDALRAQPPGFADKAAARVELNAAQRQVDRYSDLHQTRQQTGRTLNAEESRAFSDALERKSKAQQYLTSSQPIDIE
jgi:hypothetical protein